MSASTLGTMIVLVGFIGVMASVVYVIGRVLIDRYLAEADPLAQANQDLQRRPRLGQPRPLP